MVGSNRHSCSREHLRVCRKPCGGKRSSILGREIRGKLTVPVPVFAALLFLLLFAVALAAYLTPVDVGVPWQSAFWGIVNAIFIATLGYPKMTKPEDFDHVKFLLTVIVGAISGYLAYALGWTQEAIAAWFATTGIIVWIEYGLKTFVRRLSTTQRLKLFSN